VCARRSQGATQVADPEGEHSFTRSHRGSRVQVIYTECMRYKYICVQQATHCVHTITRSRKKRGESERESVLISEEHPTSHGASGGKGVQKGSQSRRTRPPNQHTHIHTLTRPFLLARCRREVSVCCFLACASRGSEFGMIPYSACVGFRSGKKKTFRAEAQRWQVVHPANAELIITQVSARANCVFFPDSVFEDHVFFLRHRRGGKKFVLARRER
jgi:hypothetical protein